MPAVFISHASDDSAWPDDEVERLAAALRDRGVEVHLDLWHRRAMRRKLSPEQWTDWMETCLKASPMVLCLASPIFAKRVAGDPDDPSGRGVGFEAMEVFRRLYNAKSRNRGWLWAARQDTHAADEVVPERYQWQVDAYVLPSEFDLLVDELSHHAIAAIQDDLRTAGPPPSPDAGALASPSSPPTDAPAARQCEVAAQRLTAGVLLWRALQRDDWDGLPSRPPLGEVTSFCAWMQQAEPAMAKVAMYAVRRAVKAASMAAGDDATALLASERAAVALYALAASRFVHAPTGKRVVPIHRSPDLADSRGVLLHCAIVSVVLAGGAVEWRPAPSDGIPAAENAFWICPAPDGYTGPGAFERALFKAVCGRRPEVTRVAGGSGPLNADERAMLTDSLDEIRHVDRSTITLVVDGAAHADAAQGFSQHSGVPVFVADPTHPDTATALIGMSPEALRAGFVSFWNSLRHPDHRPPASSTGA